MRINRALALEVREILNENKAERHIRGGMATKMKYIHEHENKVRMRKVTLLHATNALHLGEPKET